MCSGAICHRYNGVTCSRIYGESDLLPMGFSCRCQCLGRFRKRYTGFDDAISRPLATIDAVRPNKSDIHTWLCVAVADDGVSTGRVPVAYPDIQMWSFLGDDVTSLCLKTCRVSRVAVFAGVTMSLCLATCRFSNVAVFDDVLLAECTSLC